MSYRDARAWDGGPPGAEADYANQQTPAAQRSMPATDPWTGASYSHYASASYDYQGYSSGGYSTYYDGNYYQQQGNSYSNTTQVDYRGNKPRPKSPVSSYEHKQTYSSRSRSISPKYDKRERDYSDSKKRDTSFDDRYKSRRAKSNSYSSDERSRSRSYNRMHKMMKRRSSTDSSHSSHSRSYKRARDKSRTPKQSQLAGRERSLKTPIRGGTSKKHKSSLEMLPQEKPKNKESKCHSSKSKVSTRDTTVDLPLLKKIKKEPSAKTKLSTSSPKHYKRSEKSMTPPKRYKRLDRSSLTPPRAYQTAERSLTPPQTYKDRTSSVTPPKSYLKTRKSHSSSPESRQTSPRFRRSRSSGSTSRHSRSHTPRRRSSLSRNQSLSPHGPSSRSSKSPSVSKRNRKRRSRGHSTGSNSRSRSRSLRRRRKSRSGSWTSRSQNRKSLSHSPASRSHSRSRKSRTSKSRSASHSGSDSSNNEERRGQFTVADRKKFWKIHNTRKEEKAAEGSKCFKENNPPSGAIEPDSLDEIQYGDPPEVEGPNFAELPLSSDQFIDHPSTSKGKGPMPIKNDGSFLEMFKKMQESKKEEDVKQVPLIKKPALPLFGKRRGGRVLKTGLVKKAKAIDEQPADNKPKDAWSLYMQEVKKYRETSCEEERKTRPLVNIMPVEIKSAADLWTAPFDPRFPNQNKTRYCYQSYLDYHRCQKVKGQKHEPCEYFKKVFHSICPMDWVEKWDSQREEGIFPGRI